MMTWFQNFANEFYRNFIYDDRWVWMLEGFGITLQVSFFGILIGIILGVIVAAMRITQINFFYKFGLGFLDKILNWTIRAVSYLYLDIIRGTPAVTQLFIWHFVIFTASTLGNIDRVWVATIAIGVNSGAYVAEIVRAGILSIDKGQTEAGRSLGLPAIKSMGFIVMPQAVKNILPTLVNEFIVLIKETAIISIAAVVDINRAAVQIRSLTFNAWMPLMTAAIMYYIVIKILTIFLRKLERRLRQADIR